MTVLNGTWHIRQDDKEEIFVPAKVVEEYHDLVSVEGTSKLVATDLGGWVLGWARVLN